jgi:iron complex outermembrane recepter protein
MSAMLSAEISKSRRGRGYFYRFAASALALSCAGQALAQDSDSPTTEGRVSSAEPKTDEIVVTGQIEFFRPTDAESATRLRLPIAETPQAVAVLTNDTLTSVNAVFLKDVGKFVPGFVAADSFTTYPLSYVRGFEVNLLTGYRVDGGRAPGTQFDTVAVDRIEIVRGATGVAYGQNGYGGTVNTVLKKPGMEASAEFGAAYGSWNYGKIEGSVTGPLIDDKLAVRLSGTWQRHDFNGIIDGFRKTSISPSLLFTPTDRTSIRIDALYADGFSTAIGGFPILRDPATGEFSESYTRANTRRGIFYGDERQNRADLKNWFVGVDVSQKIGDALTARLRANYSKLREPNKIIGLEQFFDDPTIVADPDDIEVYATAFTFGFTAKNVEASLAGTFQPFGLETQFIVLAEHSQANFVPDDFAFEFLGTDSMRNPNLGKFNYDLSALSSAPVPSAADRSHALAAQALVRFSDQWSTLLGVRREWITLKPTNDKSSAWTPFASLMFKPAEWANLYVAYTKGFLPQTGSRRAVLDGTGSVIGSEPLSPETGAQIEAGIKLELFNKRLAVNASAYRINRRNVAVFDGLNSIGNDVYFRGDRGQRNQGVEFEIVGRVTSGLNIIANYAYLDAEITRIGVDEDPGLLGNEPGKSPRHQGTLYLNYEFIDGPLTGLSAGAGVTHIGRRFTNSENSFATASYTTVDATLQYNINDRYIATLSAANLLNTSYLEAPNASFSPQYVTYGLSRSVRLSLTAKF